MLVILDPDFYVMIQQSLPTKQDFYVIPISYPLHVNKHFQINYYYPHQINEIFTIIKIPTSNIFPMIE